MSELIKVKLSDNLPTTTGTYLAQYKTHIGNELKGGQVEVMFIDKDEEDNLLFFDQTDRVVQNIESGGGSYLWSQPVSLLGTLPS